MIFVSLDSFKKKSGSLFVMGKLYIIITDLDKNNNKFLQSSIKNGKTYIFRQYKHKNDKNIVEKIQRNYCNVQ